MLLTNIIYYNIPGLYYKTTEHNVSKPLVKATGNGTSTCKFCKYGSRDCGPNGQCEKGCVEGHWGTTCQNNCKFNASSCSACDQWSGTKCTTCPPGLFTKNESSPCSAACHTRCASCLYRPSNCKTCKDGKYNMKNRSTCTSSCPRYCQACNAKRQCTTCKSGYYGTRCSKRCASNCSSCVCRGMCTKCKALYSLAVWNPCPVVRGKRRCKTYKLCVKVVQLSPGKWNNVNGSKSHNIFRC